jgi:6-phosphofructokinase 1
MFSGKSNVPYVSVILGVSLGAALYYHYKQKLYYSKLVRNLRICLREYEKADAKQSGHQLVPPSKGESSEGGSMPELIDGQDWAAAASPAVANDVKDVLQHGESIVYMKPRHLGTIFGEKCFETPFTRRYEGENFAQSFLNETSTVVETIWRDLARNKVNTFKRFLRAGPRTKLYWEPSKVTAAIVTCGGLCPGLNNVIRGITQMLTEYGVTKIYGIKNGYMGFSDPTAWITLNMKTVETIHHQGGSFLVANRGNEDPKVMAKALMQRGVNQLYVIGGDGTHRGAAALLQELDLLNYEISVVGIPKTIDNDIPLIDVSFGFGTAVAEAVKAVQAAYVEASGAPNCIGLVKLMGRSSGFVALYTVCASAVVDVSLLPEMEDIHLPTLLNYIKQKIQQKGRCVVVVAEGCGKSLMEVDPNKKDAGGNIKLPDVGVYLKDKIMEYSKTNKLDWNLKLLDPTYMIRAVPANAYDAVYCHVLAHNAVHSAMAGYTGISIGRVDQHYVMIPINLIAENPPRQVNVAGRWFQRMLMMTEQCSLTPPGKVMRQSSFVLQR